jgi:hypothetical protein
MLSDMITWLKRVSCVVINDGQTAHTNSLDAMKSFSPMIYIFIVCLQSQNEFLRKLRRRGVWCDVIVGLDCNGDYGCVL